MITTEQITVMLQEAGYDAQYYNESFLQLMIDERTYIISAQESDEILTYSNISVIYSDFISTLSTEMVFKVYNKINQDAINVKMSCDLQGGNTTNLSSGFWVSSAEDYLLYFQAALRRLDTAAEFIEDNLFQGRVSSLGLRG